MKITLNETEIKKAIIMFLETKMSLKGSLDVELSTQGKGGQTILATVDLDSEDLGTKEETPLNYETTKEVKEEPKKEDKVENTSEKTVDNPDNDSSLFGSDDSSESEKETPKEIATASPFGNF